MAIFETRSDLQAAVKKLIGGQRIRAPGNSPGMKVQEVVTFFETVQLLQNGDRDDEIVFGELVDAGTIVQNYIGVENKRLGRIFFAIAAGSPRGIGIGNEVPAFAGIGIHLPTDKSVPIRRSMQERIIK